MRQHSRSFARRTLGRALVSLSALTALAGAALGVDEPNLPPEFLPPPGLGVGRVLEAAKFAKPDGALPQAATKLIATYPGVGVTWWNGRMMSIGGSGMSGGKDALDAATSFLAQHDASLGAGKLELTPLYDNPISNRRFHVFHYRQSIDGVPVEFGRATVLVRTAPENPKIDNRVVLFGGKLAMKPAEGFAPDLVDGAHALAGLQNHPHFESLTQWSQPEMVIYFGEGDLERWVKPFRAWKISGRDPNPQTLRSFTFFVDAANGELVHARSNIHFADLNVQVRANVTTNSGAAVASNPLVLSPLSDVTVNASSGGSLLTNAAGNVTFSTALSSLTVDTGVIESFFAPVGQLAGQELGSLLTASTTSSVPGTTTLTLNTTPSEATTSQVNALFHQTLTRNHFASRADPSITVPDLSFGIPANVNIDSASGITSCNAFYDGLSTNFFRLKNGCNNSAFGSVAAHEYGHHIVAELGLAQGAFGEGFGDTMSMMVYDDGIIGTNFRIDGGIVRNPDTANVQYPCPQTASHFCGQILGGVVWDMRNLFVSQHGSTQGLALLRQLHIDWAQVTGGGQAANSAHPTTAIEFLTLDDNDANLDNGTPNRNLIGGAFFQHSISIPPLEPLTFSFPNGIPSTISSVAPTTIRVDVSQNTDPPQPGSGTLFYRLSPSTTFVSAPMASVGTNQYLATIPVAPCGTIAEFYFSALTTGGAPSLSPANAPASFYSAISGTAGSVLDDDFEIDRGWTIDAGTTTNGAWARGNPEGTTAQPEDDHTPAPGVNCYATGLAAGTAVGTFDIDGGTTTLTSPVFSLDGAAEASISYWRWYDNSRGSAPNADTFLVEISSNNGSTWTTIETIGPATQNTGGWVASQLWLSDFPAVARTSSMRLRFNASDLATGSVVEAAVDDVNIVAYTCGSTCPADLDDGSGAGTPDGGVDINDLIYFLAGFEAGNIAVDLDNGSGSGTPDGGVDINDLIYFLTRFEAGC